MTRYGGPVHTGADINIHTHADLFKHMAPTQYARTRTHTHTDTYANYKSDNCRHDGALGEGEVKA